MRSEPSPNVMEICFNLWMVQEKETGHIYSYMGKCYALRGTREQKLQILHALSADDHYTVPRRKLPDRFRAQSEGEWVSGLASLEIARNPNSGFWNELIDELERDLPPQIRWNGGTPMEIRTPIFDDPLTIRTLLVEEANGVLFPKVQTIEELLGGGAPSTTEI